MKTATLLGAAPGEKLTLEPDWFVLTDGTAHTVPALLGGRKPKDPGKVKVFIDHETPCGSEKVAAHQKALVSFAREQGCELSNGYGIAYQLMLDKAVRPGQLVVHCGDFGSIYAAAGALAVKLSPEELAQAMVNGEISLTVPEAVCLELSGELRSPAGGKDAALAVLKLLGSQAADRLLLVCGGGLDSLTGSERLAFFQLLSACGCAAVLTAPAAKEDALQLDLSAVVPMVSPAEDFSAAVPAAELPEKEISAVFIGGCSQGRIEDIRAAAALCKGKRVQRKVRVTVAFASTEVYVQAANEGLIDTLLDAGAVVMNQGCSACYAHSQGLVDLKDTVLSTGSRPCPDCLGSGKNVETWLCSAATAMSSALTGHICPAE